MSFQDIGSQRRPRQCANQVREIPTNCPLMTHVLREDQTLLLAGSEKNPQVNFKMCPRLTVLKHVSQMNLYMP